MLVRRLLLAVRRRDESGAVAVEAAFITPVLLLLVFGMIDMSLLIKDNVAVVSAVRAGARVASAESAVPGTTTGGAYVPGFAGDTVAAMNRATTNLDRVETTTNDKGEVKIGTRLYLTTVEGGTEPTAIGDSCTGQTNCLMYEWSDDAHGFELQPGGSWGKGSVDACPISPSHPEGPDAIRVTLRSPHSFITPALSSSFQLDDTATMNFEPQPAAVCASST
jgi:Flp pilus assembly protein TadG